MKVRFKKIHKDAHMPERKHVTDAGYDLWATSMTADDHGNVVYGTGISIEIPQYHVGLVFPRSSNANTGLILTNSVGVIDSGYRGEIMAKFAPIRSLDHAWQIGDRIAQLIIIPIPEICFEESETLSDSDRGQGGYGSTGKE